MSIVVPLEGFGGGGGASLNFDVKAYATESTLLAATPKENTIGIITTTALTSWIFSATGPTEAAEGMVWISTGTSSTIEFNALKKNGIQVYPISAKQYKGGSWVDVTAMSYRNGEWVPFDDTLWIVKDGIACYQAKTSSSGSSVSSDGNGLVFKSTESGYHTMKLVDIDLTKHNTLYVVGNAGDEFVDSAKQAFNIYDSSEAVVATSSFTKGSSINFTIDISGLSGIYAIGFYWLYLGSVTVTNMWAE